MVVWLGSTSIPLPPTSPVSKFVRRHTGRLKKTYRIPTYNLPTGEGGRGWAWFIACLSAVSSPPKRIIQHFQNVKFLLFVLFWWVIFGCLDPDPVSQSVSISTDNWIRTRTLICRCLLFLLRSVSDPYSFFPDPDPEVEAGDQYGYGSGSGSNPDPRL